MSNITNNADPAPDYVFGHSDQELDRLIAQARLVDPFTGHLLREAGIGPGLRLLDVGSGAGDTAFLAAELVGTTGDVIGTDRAPVAVATANKRAQARGLTNVHFREGDPAGLAFEQPFDAVVGRYVLWSQPDPAQMLRRLAGHLRPGGVIIFHEPDWSFVRSLPPTPTYDRCCRWIVETALLAGTHWNMVNKLHAAFVDAGLAAPTMRMETFISGGKRVEEWLRAVTAIAASFLPAMERLGVATAAEVDLPTLFERLSRDVAANGSVIIGRSEIGAWSRS